MANITYIRIGDEVYRLHDGNALTSESNLDASKVRGTLPANTYTNTTYENKTAVEGGTEVSLVTTGDKYRWDQGGSGSEEIFIVEYEVTPYQDIMSAIESRKAVYGIYGSEDAILMPFAFFVSNETIYLEGIFETGYVTWIITDSTWEETSDPILGVDGISVNGTLVPWDSNRHVDLTIPTKTSNLTNDSNFQNATQVDSAINTRIASVYKAKGSVAFANLPALTSSNEGFVYDINESFTTTSNFVEGAGKTYPAGTNVVIIDTGSGVYKYDVLAGLIDLSGKQDLLVSGTNIKTINNQSILGSGDISVSTVAAQIVRW